VSEGIIERGGVPVKGFRIHDLLPDFGLSVKIAPP